MSSPPVDAFILKSMACDALSINTKQSRSSHRSPIMEVDPGSSSRWYGSTRSQKSISGPNTSEA